MDYEDRISIVTPEGVTLELGLAGIGSRFVAALVDAFIRLALVVAVLLLVAAFGGTSIGVLQAILVLTMFFAYFGYDVLFETLASGRTPGKRWTGLRVVRKGGGAVGFWSSTIRNLVRLIDAQPGTTYVVGTVSILVTRNNQRLGDLAAGTLVVREQRVSRRGRDTSWAAMAAGPPELPDDAVHWDLSGITSEQLVAVRRFLDRRSTLTDEARTRLAGDLAARLRPLVVGPDEHLPPEAFLEVVAAAKTARS